MTNTIPDSVIQEMADEIFVKWRDGARELKTPVGDMVVAALRAAEAAGWVLVPREPTPNMVAASCVLAETTDMEIYTAMLAARPKAPE